jgi:hypothetical protein
VTFLLALFLSGCSSGGGQLGTLRTQNRTLLEQNKTQLAEIENLRAHARWLQDKLESTEQELTALEDADQPQPRRLASKGSQNSADNAPPIESDQDNTTTRQWGPDRR